MEKFIKIDDICYGDSIRTGQGINYGQDIINKKNSEVIGWLETRIRGLWQPLNERYQMVMDFEPPKIYAYSETEDEGYWRVYFDTIEDFIAGYNDLIINRQ